MTVSLAFGCLFAAGGFFGIGAIDRHAPLVVFALGFALLIAVVLGAAHP